MTGMLQLEFVRFKELEKLTRIKAGISGDVEKRLKRGRVIEELLKQDANAPVPMEDQAMVLLALHQGFLNNVEPEETRRRLAQMLHQMHTVRADLVAQLVARREFTDEIKEGLHAELVRLANAAV
jgi:F-type H+-transporting ATPase subunit alpha